MINANLAGFIEIFPELVGLKAAADVEHVSDVVINRVGITLETDYSLEEWQSSIDKPLADAAGDDAKRAQSLLKETALDPSSIMPLHSFMKKNIQLPVKFQPAFSSAMQKLGAKLPDIPKGSSLQLVFNIVVVGLVTEAMPQRWFEFSGAASAMQASGSSL